MVYDINARKFKGNCSCDTHGKENIHYLGFAHMDGVKHLWECTIGGVLPIQFKGNCSTVCVHISKEMLCQ